MNDPQEAAHPTQPVVEDDKGTLRFKSNAIVRFMLDTLRNLGAFDLNKASVMEFSNEDRRQFAQLIGYSLGGYEDLSYSEGDPVRERASAPQSQAARPTYPGKVWDTHPAKVGPDCVAGLGDHVYRDIKLTSRVTSDCCVWARQCEKCQRLESL